MLLRVETIEDIGRFKSLKHKAPRFGELTVLFARNGLGKSTICSIIRSASENDNKIIKARRRLGSEKEPAIHLNWKNHGAVTYASDKWNACPGPVHVFDGEFVRRNLHIGESVTRANKRSLIPIVLGEEGVTIFNRISELDAEQRDLASKLSTCERQIKQLCPVVSDVKAFVEKDVENNIDQQISRAKKNLELAKQSAAVKIKPVPMIIPLIDTNEIEAILSETILSITEHAGTVLQGHLTKHGMLPGGTKWIKYGFEHMLNEQCPFCTQTTSTIDLITIFKGYFSAEYTNLDARINTICDQFRETYGANGEKLSEYITQIDHDFEFWSALCDFDHVPRLDDDDLLELTGAVRQLAQLLELKKAKPLKAVSILDTSLLTKIFEKLKAYTDRLTVCIGVIAAAKTETATLDVRRAQEIHDKLEALSKKLSGSLYDEVAIWKELSVRKIEVEAEKKSAQDKLRVYTAKTIGEKQAAINNLLELFGTRFRISKTNANFVGREANLKYSISIGDHTVEVGESTVDTPSFMTVLSAGDKSTLAFTFFLLQVRESAKFSDSTIILDDPFSSQDLDRQWETTSQIRALAREACQIIILSHDPRFLALIEKNAHGSCHSFQILCDDIGQGSIEIWNPEDELREIYVRQAERIREYASCGRLLPSVTTESLIKDLRPFLEDYIRARFPGRFTRLIKLDEMTKQIEAAGSNDPLYHKTFDLRALNEFSRDNMHGGAAAPVPAALRAQCKRVVSIIGSY